MSRPLRIEFPDAVYGVNARGNERRSIYLVEADRLDFLGDLEQAVSRFAWLCHTYCLMGNHYHLLLETPRPNLAQGMRQLNGVYAQRFNARHRRVGHLFQGRYAAGLVQKDSHLLELCRYIVLNPVRAGLCRRPEEWRWSSYRATAGEVEAPPFLTTGWILEQFSIDLDVARAGYKTYVAEGLAGAAPAFPFAAGEEFRRRHSRRRSVPEVPRVYWQPHRPSLEEIFAQDQASAVAVAYRDYGYRMREIAEHLAVSYSTISRRLQQLEDQQAG